MSVELCGILSEVRKLMPSQGPLEFFVHHNTFHGLESLPFKDALLKGWQLYEGQVFKKISEYQKNYCEGKISDEAIHHVLEAYLKKRNLFTHKNIELSKNLLHISSDLRSRQKLNNNFLIDLSKKCFEKTHFFKTLFLKTYYLDIDEVIAPPIFRFLSSYFDQGSAYWKMPDRQKGLLEAFKYNFGFSPFSATQWEKRLTQSIRFLETYSAQQIIQYGLDNLGLKSEHYHSYIFDLAYRYKGWGGIVISLERHPEWNKKADIVASYEEFIAILILCEHAFLSAQDTDKLDFLKHRIPTVEGTPSYSNSYLHYVERLILCEYTKDETSELLIIVGLLNDFERQFLWQQAYEESFYDEFLSSFQKLQSKNKKERKSPSLQVLCCIDDREESFRRYIERQSYDYETYGVAGHFGLDINYKGIFEAHYRALCPDMISPTKRVTEKINKGSEFLYFYRLWAILLWIQSLSSRTLLRGFIFQFLTGIIAMFSLSLDIVSPYAASRLRRLFKKRLDQNLKTYLEYDEKVQGGMSLADRVCYALNLLNTVGMKVQFAPVVAILGHGSHSLNNPHEAAYNCGACGGGRGAPNARLICEILNQKLVREALTQSEIFIPTSTLFIGGYHNTCSDEVIFFDLPDHNMQVEKAVQIIRNAAKEDALERCRRFEEVPLSTSAAEALSHCVTRANNYMQPRPEYNHATNAICIVGPRDFSRELFLDRRAFLTSYEPDNDSEDSTILKNILSAVGPVCSGINLEYYFSYMDNEVYGCGTKLPHNVTSLVGVMNGFQSDLRPGLSSQMIEIHDPYRLMMLIVAECKKVKRLIKEIPSFQHLVQNGWINLSVFDPKDRTLYRYQETDFNEVDLSNFPEISYPDNRTAFANSRQACRIGILGA